MEVKLEFPGLGLISYSDLHAHFDDLMNVFSKNSKNESCLSMSLEYFLKILACLEYYNFTYGMFSENYPDWYTLSYVIYYMLKEDYFEEMFN